MNDVSNEIRKQLLEALEEVKKFENVQVRINLLNKVAEINEKLK